MTTLEHVTDEVNAVINALNRVSVSGKQNFDAMSGSLSVLMTVVEELRAECARMAAEEN